MTRAIQFVVAETYRQAEKVARDAGWWPRDWRYVSHVRELDGQVGVLWLCDTAHKHAEYKEIVALARKQRMRMFAIEAVE